MKKNGENNEMVMLEIKCIIHAVVNSLCGLRSCLSCGTCTTFVCSTDTLRIQAITAEEVESRFASEWETDHSPLRGPATVSWWRGLVPSRSDLLGD